MATVEIFNRYGHSVSKAFPTEAAALAVAEMEVMSPNASEIAIRVIVRPIEGVAYGFFAGGNAMTCTDCGGWSDPDFKDGRICVDCYDS